MGASLVMRWLSYRLMTLAGWSFAGEFPDIPKLVVIGAPHTSNWDFFLFLAALHHFDLRVRFLGKQSLFRWPFGWMFRRVGGIAVDRSKPGGIVEQVEAAFESEEELILVIAPEGTRRPAPLWKSGFVEIALQAGVPVVCAGVNSDRKTLTVGDPHTVGDDRKAFMNGIRPEGKGPVQIAGEPSLS